MRTRILPFRSFYSELIYTILDLSTHSFYLYVFCTKLPPLCSEGIKLNTCILLRHPIDNKNANGKYKKNNPKYNRGLYQKTLTWWNFLSRFTASIFWLYSKAVACTLVERE